LVAADVAFQSTVPESTYSVKARKSSEVFAPAGTEVLMGFGNSEEEFKVDWGVGEDFDDIDRLSNIYRHDRRGVKRRQQ
jgi:hypothetical protein